MSSDRFREFETFVCVVESGSFSAASRKLGCTPSAVSKLVERMENRLGVRLMQRTSRSLTLTEEGKNFYHAAARVLESISEAESGLMEDDAPAAGLLRVHTTLNFAQHEIAPILPTFLAQHPQLRIEFHLNSEPINLTDADLDVSIQVGPVNHPSLVAKRISTTRWLLCAAPSYLERAGIPQIPDDLQHHNCLNFLPQTYRAIWPLGADDALPPTRYELQGNVASNSDNLLRVFARRGMGIVRLTDFHVRQDLLDGELREVLGEYSPQAPEPVYAVYQSRRNLSRRVKVFLKFLEGHMSQAVTP